MYHATTGFTVWLTLKYNMAITGKIDKYANILLITYCNNPIALGDC